MFESNLKLSLHEKLWLAIASLLTGTIVIILLTNKLNDVFFTTNKIETFEANTSMTTLSHTSVNPNKQDIKGEEEEEEEEEPLEPSAYDGPKFGYDYYPSIEGFQEGLALDDLSKPFKQMGDFFKILGTIGERIGRFIKSFFEFGEGALLALKNVGEIAVVTMEDVFGLAFNSFACFLTFIKNFRQCIVFWVIDFILHLMKALFIQFPMYLILVLTGLDLQPMLDIFIDEILKPLDDVISSIIGYRFMQYPQWVYDSCYTCNLMPSFYKIGDDFGLDGRVSNLFWQPVSKFIQGGQDFMSMFEPL